MSLEAWRAFLGLLRPPGAHPLLAYRLGAWPADCRPLRDVTDHLDRLFPYAVARAMRPDRANSIILPGVVLS